MKNICRQRIHDLRQVSRFQHMPTLRKGAGSSRLAAHSGQPGILLDNESPYGSRRVVVEYDGATTAAYLHDADAIVGAAWIANHQQAPSSTDQPPLDARALRALWFEEGDGVAIIEGGQLLAVIPGWSDMSRGMPGYSRDVMGQSPFGWSLDDA